MAVRSRACVWWRQCSKKNRKIRPGIINTAPSTTEPLLYRRHLPAARPSAATVRRLPSGAAQSIDAKYLQRREARGVRRC